MRAQRLKAKKPSKDFPFLNLILPKNFPTKDAKASPTIDIAKPTREYFPNINTHNHTPIAITVASLKFLLS